MSGNRRELTASQKRNAAKAAAAKKTVESKPTDEKTQLSDEEQYQQELKDDAEAEKKEKATAKASEMNGAGNALRRRSADAAIDAVVADAKIVSDEATKVVEEATKVVEDAVKVVDAAVNVATDAKILVDEAAKINEPVLATSHPDMCDPSQFGKFDPNSDYCKDCLITFSECANACKALTDHNSAKATPGTKAVKLNKGGGKRTGNKVLIASADSGAGKIDLLLCRPEGCTMEEMRVHRGAVTSHLAALKAAGFVIALENGRYYHRPAAPTA